MEPTGTGLGEPTGTGFSGFFASKKATKPRPRWLPAPHLAFLTS